MKPNRKSSKRMNVHTQRTYCVAGIIFSLFIMVVFNLLVKGSTEQVAREIQQKNRELARLNAEYERQNAIWEGMKTDQKLRSALMHLGLRMNTPIDAQVVRMGSDRRVRPGQLSVVKAHQALNRVASYSSIRAR